MTFLIVFVLSTLLSLMLTPIISHVSHKNGWLDELGERKIHTVQVSRLGGVAISLSFYLAFPIALLVISALKPGGVLVPGTFYLLLAIGIGYNLLGLADDFRNLKAFTKFVVQVLLAIAVVASHYSFKAIEIPIPPYRLELGLLGPIITVVWIVGITNAINLIDGMDGLAGGIGLIGSIVWAMLFLKTGQLLPALVALACAGAILGFLFFNFPPATIFMGDSGSLFLGFLLAILPLLGNSNERVVTGIVPAITVCLIPILDTFAAMLRRARRGVSFFTADKYHLHHKLLDLGFSARQVLALIYSLCGLLGFCALIAVYADRTLSFWLMMTGWFLWGAIFMLLHLLRKRNVRLFQKPDREGAE